MKSQRTRRSARKPIKSDRKPKEESTLSRGALRRAMEHNSFETTLTEVPEGREQRLLALFEEVGIPKWIKEGLQKETQRRSFQWIQNVLMFLDPGRRGQTLKRVRDSLVSDSSSTRWVSYRNVKIRADAPPAKQPIFDAVYGRVIERPFGNKTQQEVDRVMKLGPVTEPGSNVPVKLLGTLVIRPGLSNVAPSAPYVFRMAQHADKVVLAYTNFDERNPKAQLRPLSEFGGVKVPDSLQGKLFAIGTPEHWVQPATAGAGQLIAELEALRTQSKKWNIDASKLSLVGISQGGLEGVLARQILAAYGFPHAIEQLVTVGSPMRGSWLAFKSLGWETATRALGFSDASRVSKILTPEEPENRIAEFMRSSVDLAVTGSLPENLSDLKFSPSKQMWLLRRIAQVFGLADKVGDGLVDAVSDPFVGNKQSHVHLEKTDHFALLAEASSADACLAHLGTKRDSSLNPLEIIAYGASSRPRQSP